MSGSLVETSGVPVDGGHDPDRVGFSTSGLAECCSGRGSSYYRSGHLGVSRGLG